MERPALFVGDAEGEESTLDEREVRERMEQGLPPESAEEYLLRVRIESQDLPDVVEAHVPDEVKKKQTKYMPPTEPVPSCAVELLPSDEWEREVLSTFVELRQYLRRWKATSLGNPAQREPVPALKDDHGWHIFCLGCVEGEDDFAGGGRTSATGGKATAATTASRGKAAFTSNNVVFDPTNDDDAQSTYCVAPVESLSRFDKFSATLAQTAEVEQKQEGSEGGEDKASINRIEEGDEGKDQDDEDEEENATVQEEGDGEEAEGTATAASGSPKRPYGKEWLSTHPRGSPPTLRLAIQFDQVLTQKVLAFHAGWLKSNLLSRARAVWIYTLLACLEKPLGSETAALVRELLRRCCAQRADLESLEDESLPALNVIVVIAGTYFQQAELVVTG